MKDEEATCGTCRFPTCTGEHSNECKKQQAREVRVVGEIQRGIAHIWDQGSTQAQREVIVRGLVDEALASEFTRSLLSDEDVEQMKARLDEGLSDKDPEAFTASVLKAVKPMLDVRLEHAKAFEDAQALEIMEKQGFTPVNERVSYSLHEGQLHLHLAPSFEVKDQIEGLYEDALVKVAQLVRSQPDILRIGGGSWLNATETFSEMKKRLGFEISDLTDKDRESGHYDETERPIKNALMSREDFLHRYGGASV